MTRPLLLASASPIRLQMLRNAGLDVTALAARIDEAAIRAGLQADAASPRDIADALAELKAHKIAARNPEALVLGCDQVLAFDGEVWGKPQTEAEALTQLRLLRGKSHHLLSAAVLFDGGRAIWRHVGAAQLTMHPLSDAYLADGQKDLAVTVSTRRWPASILRHLSQLIEPLDDPCRQRHR